MAICFLETKSINRASGQSAVASASYRSGEKLTDERIGKTFDYGKKGGILSTTIITPTGMDDDIDRGELWNTAEKAEKRKDGRTAREILINVPHELMNLNHELGGELVRQFAQTLSDDFGVGIDVAIHAPSKQGDDRNYHAHLLMTTRKISVADGVISLGDKAQLELSDTKLKQLKLPRSKDTLDRIKETWATLTNEHLKANGIAETIDHRSHADRGLDTLPQVKMGHTATALERKGVRTAKGDINRAVRQHNALTRHRAKMEQAEQAQEWEYIAELSAQYRDDLVLTPSVWADMERYEKEQAEWMEANAEQWDLAYERYERQQAEQERQAQWEHANAHHRATAIELFRGQIGIIKSTDPTPLQAQKMFATARVLRAYQDRQGLTDYIARTTDSDIARHRQALEQVSQDKQLYRQSSTHSTDTAGYPFARLSNSYNSSTPPEPLKTAFDSVQAVLLGKEWRERLNPHRTQQNAMQDDLRHEQGQENKPPAPKI